MGEFEEIPIKFLSTSSSENGDSIGSLTTREDEEFYEKIEAPKFVDFSLPDHYSPDDHYWFCLRVGCDQKHEEEMDSEAIYNNFVLRVMAARSPNVRLRKALNRNANASRCPHSAPPKSSKPRLSRMAVISSFSKIAEEKKKVVRPLLKPGSTPATKTKPVAAKYLTTPRNKKCTSDKSSFRSVQHSKPVDVEVPTSRIVAKALVFRSPKKATKVKTSVELRTPISKLCQRMNKLEISSQRQRVLGYSSKLSSQKAVQAMSDKPLQTCKVRPNLSQQESKKFLGIEETQSLMNDESSDNRKVPQESCNEACTYPTVSLATLSSDMVSPDGLESEVKERDASISKTTKAEKINSIPQPTNRQEINISTTNENITEESCAEPQFKANNSSEGNELEDGDESDKENAAASDENRMANNSTLKKNGRKLLGVVVDNCDRVRKKVTQTQENTKVAKVKKSKATNPKPFRLRTDERGVLKESILDRRVNPLVCRSENTNVSTPTPVRKLPQKHVNDVHERGVLKESILDRRVDHLVCRSENTNVSTPTPVRKLPQKHHERKLKSNAMQRLEKFRKLTSPLHKQNDRPEGKKQGLISYLIPGQKLEVIPEASPEVSETPSGQKSARDAPPPTDDSNSRSSSHRRKLIPVVAEPKFHSTHLPRSCTKKLK